jgi:hypothetical protein
MLISFSTEAGRVDGYGVNDTTLSPNLDRHAGYSLISAVSEGIVGQNCSTKFRMLKNSGNFSAPPACLMMRSVPSRHETIEECRELLIAIERKNMRDVLVWPHDHHAPFFAINATHGEDVVAAF